MDFISDSEKNSKLNNKQMIVWEWESSLYVNLT